MRTSLIMPGALPLILLCGLVYAQPSNDDYDSATVTPSSFLNSDSVDATNATLMDELTMEVEAGTTYRIKVGQSAGGNNAGTVVLNIGEPPPPPHYSCKVNTVSQVSESSNATYEACETLIVGPAFIAENGASIMLSSGVEIRLNPGFLINQGAVLNAAVCGKSLCATSTSPMPYGCHSCVVQICDIDTACCDTAFNQACLDKVYTVCGLACG